jgi:Protein of unknown function (DUF5818)
MKAHYKQRTPLLLIAALLISVSLLSAQQKGQCDNSGKGNSSTVHGCVRRAPGAFTLATASGTTYEITGDSSQLNKMAGKQVQVTGEKSSSTDISTGESK